MIKIPLYGKDEGRHFTCSEEDAAFAMSGRWYQGTRGYVINRKGQYFHILALGYADRGLEWDHIDGNRLNNCRSNLRMCTHSQNNTHLLRKNTSSGVPGVSYKKSHNKWVAYASIAGKVKHLGIFDNFDDAVKARMAVVEKLLVEGTKYAR